MDHAYGYGAHALADHVGHHSAFSEQHLYGYDHPHHGAYYDVPQGHGFDHYDHLGAHDFSHYDPRFGHDSYHGF